MKAMSKAAEFYQAPPPGRYNAECVLATARDEQGNPLVSKAKSDGSGGVPMIHLKWEIVDGPHAGEQADDRILTDGNAKGAGYSKRKLRALGFDVDSDIEIPDDQIATTLLGRRCVVEFGNENREVKENDSYVRGSKATAIDPKTGQTIFLMRLNIKDYVPAIAGAQQGAPQYAQPGQSVQQAPQQGYQAPAPFPQAQFAPAPQAQFTPQAPAPVAAAAPVQQAAPQLPPLPPGWVYQNVNGQFVPTQAGAQIAAPVPVAQPAPFFPTAPIGGAVPASWPPNGAPVAAAAAAADTTGKGKRAKGKDADA